jgi:hypothetical protein
MTFKETAGQIQSQSQAKSFITLTLWLEGEGGGKEERLHRSYNSSIVSLCLKQRIVFYYCTTRWIPWFVCCLTPRFVSYVQITFYTWNSNNIINFTKTDLSCYYVSTL